MPRDYDEEDPENQEEEEQPEEEEEQPEEEPAEEEEKEEEEEEEVDWAYSTCQGNKKAVFVSLIGTLENNPTDHRLARSVSTIPAAPLP